MPVTLVVGAQWGDEGKGKIIDLLTECAQHVVRCQGGNNAGHTILIGQEEYKLHLVPSGILQPHTQCYIGAGTVIDPHVLAAEIHALESRGIRCRSRLWLAPTAHVIMPYHRQIDNAMEAAKGNASIGTTGRGIGPCYSDKAMRLGIRLGELANFSQLEKTLQSVLPIKMRELKNVWGIEPSSLSDISDGLRDAAEFLSPFIRDVNELIYEALENKENILLEGAQGSLLDITLGTYPYVTSSNTTAAGILSGSGLGPAHINHSLGVFKAYLTRVGQGPFPTEIKEETSGFDHVKAREFGTTTGRKRRIGWFDAVLAQTAVKQNALTSIAMTKLDVLDSLDSLKICVAYQLDGKTITEMPWYAKDLERVVPIYETVPGWKCATTEIKNMEDLPAEAHHYLKQLERLLKVPISILSLGPHRDRSIIINHPLKTYNNLGNDGQLCR